MMAWQGKRGTSAMQATSTNNNRMEQTNIAIENGMYGME